MLHESALIGIAIRPPGKRDMLELQHVRITREMGVEGDKRSRPGKRQVTLMSLSSWQQACAELGVELHWTTRRANLLVDQLPLQEQVGAHIRIGDLVLEVTGETDPCKRMEEASPGLLEALKPDWRGGVTCRVIESGDINIGQTVIMSNNGS
ncbi:MAG: MOSC domain-containing protein [Gammaproteobacteria bacterium]|nr:MOSC domain-containing protein [Gammaproteobacteria bacterium]